MMAPRDLPTVNDVSEMSNALINRCKSAVSSISSRAENFKWQEQIPTGIKQNAQVTWDKVKDNAVVERLTGIKENAQVTWDKVKDNSVVERLNGIKENAQVTWYKVKDNASVEKLTEQVKESPIWKVSPATMAVMGFAALPIISFLFIMLIGLSPAFLAFLAVEGTFLTVGAGIVTGLVVSVGGVVLSIATVMGSIYFAVTKIISFTKSKINNIQPHPSLNLDASDSAAEDKPSDEYY